MSSGLDSGPRTRVIGGGQHDAPRSAPTRRWWAWVGAISIALALAVGLAVPALRGGPRPPAAGPLTAGGPTLCSSVPLDLCSSGPAPVQVDGGFQLTHQVAGVAVGYPRTEAGARSAAANYLVAYGSPLVFVPASRHALLTAMLDPAVRATMLAQTDVAFSATADRFGLGQDGQPTIPGVRFVSRTLPVGVRTVSFGPDTAVVSVWAAGLLGLAGGISPMPVTETWSTTTLTLRWAGGDWKWVSFTGETGPTPVPSISTPSGAQAIADAVSGFGGLTYG